LESAKTWLGAKLMVLPGENTGSSITPAAGS
jgi:hypothetical protein